jgi:hypothetical protein
MSSRAVATRVCGCSFVLISALLSGCGGTGQPQPTAEDIKTTENVIANPMNTMPESMKGAGGPGSIARPENVPAPGTGATGP